MAAGKGAREEELRTRTTHVRRWRQIRQQRGEGGVCRVGPGFDFCAFLRVRRRAPCYRCVPRAGGVLCAALHQANGGGAAVHIKKLRFTHARAGAGVSAKGAERANDVVSAADDGRLMPMSPGKCESYPGSSSA